MYAAFFGLKQAPFSIAPDPRYLFMSERHREALAHLLYGVDGGGGFVLLSGEIGAGKTTVCRCFLEQIPRKTNVAYIFNPKLTALELLNSVCEEFGIARPANGIDAEHVSIKDYLDALNDFLLKTHAVGQNNVLIIDEAQMLSAEVLEQLRLLTNLETNERKLLQIILIGQPELRDMLERPELEQLAQRVIARYHLDALTAAETEAYIRHRLSVSGMTSSGVPFDAKAIARIHELARGLPRRINLLCDRALLGAYALGKGVVDRDIVDKAAGEVFGQSRRAARLRAKRRHTIALWATSLATAAAAGVGVLLLLDSLARRGVAPVKSAATAASASAAAASGAVSGAASGAASATSATLTASTAASAPPLSAAELASRYAALGRDEDAAWRALAPAWKVTLAADGKPCASAAAQQLQCFRAPGSTLALVRQLDRPGLITLFDANDKPVHALLVGLGAQTATLRLGDTTQTIPLTTLATLWRGDYATLWRAPPGYTGKAADTAASGPVATWVAGRLGSAPSVAAFQIAQGLKADGVIGPTTLMQLNRTTGIDEPHLRGDTSP